MEIKAHHCVCGSDRDRLASVTKKQNRKIADLEAYIVELEADANEMMDSIQVLIEKVEAWQNEHGIDDQGEVDFIDSQKSNLEHWRGKREK